MKFEYYRSSKHAWRWRLVGRNGEIVASGEGYTRKASCLRAIERMKADIPNAIVEMADAVDGLVEHTSEDAVC